MAAFAEPSEGEPVLGIIGGAGVGAAARLYIDVSSLVRSATGGLPRIALWNLPLTDAIEQAFTAASPAAQTRALVEGLIAEAFDRLGEAGATVIAMPCNSLQRSAAPRPRRSGVASPSST